MADSGLVEGDDGITRCSWGDAPEIYRVYHDTEWGFPVRDDRRLFEKICLEGFQAGLSWLTILRKRENFRAAFAGFDFERVARFGERDVERLLGDAGIIRHRGKIEATINNAQRALELVETEGSIADYVWRFEGEADGAALSKDLKKRGWRFVGPTTVYAFMQAMGLVNDHVDGCAIRAQVRRARAAS
jgi:DNA-3-methyladenine glycosylase I